MVNQFSVLTAKLENMSQEIARLKKIINTRELADPLIASECSVESGLGESRNRPCRTTFDRLLQAPEKFHSRWVMVSGLYVSGFEESALYSENYNRIAPDILQHHSAIWVNPELSSGGSGFSKRRIVGKFHNGPSGHMSAYFGELNDASKVAESKRK